MWRWRKQKIKQLLLNKELLLNSESLCSTPWWHFFCHMFFVHFHIVVKKKKPYRDHAAPTHSGSHAVEEMCGAVTNIMYSQTKTSCHSFNSIAQVCSIFIAFSCCLYLYVRVNIYIHIPAVRVRMYTHIHTYTFMYILFVYVFMCVSTYIQTHIYTVL